MSEDHNHGRLWNIKQDWQRFWKDLISYYKLPSSWDRRTWQYVVAGIVVFPGLFLVDPYIRAGFAQIHTQFFDTVFSFAHWYGKIYLTLYSFLTLYLIGFAVNHERLRNAGWKIFEAFAISGITITVIKSILGRWRPYTGHGSLAFVGFTFGPNDHLSLPSGDVGIAFAYSMVIASFSANKIWKALWYFLAVLTCFGRIYHDQHWFSDVLLASIISISVGIYLNKTSAGQNISNRAIEISKTVEEYHVG